MPSPGSRAELLEQLDRRFRLPLLAYFGRRVRSAAEAEDLTLEEVLAALEELGERTRAMFYLYRFEDLKVREIADMYGISASGVEKQLAKALMHLTRRLSHP